MNKIRKSLLSVYNLGAKLYLNPLLKAERRKPVFPTINERSLEYGFIFDQLRKLWPDRILDVGSGRSSWPHILYNCGFNVTAIDRMDEYWTGAFTNRHFHIINDDITATRITDHFPFITCISVLEHIPGHSRAVGNMISLLEEGGRLILTFPYNETAYHRNIYQHPEAGYGKDASFITQIYSRSEVNGWLESNPVEIVEQKYFKVFTGEFWTFGKRISPPIEVSKDEHHHLTCLALKKK